jgi:TolB protein
MTGFTGRIIETLRRALSIGAGLCVGMALAGIGAARADLVIDITKGTVEPLPIAISPFYAAGAQETEISHNVVSVISADLERSGLFRPLDPKSFLQDPAALRLTPRFEDWRVIKAQALVSGEVENKSDGRVRIGFRLWDVLAGQPMDGFATVTEPTAWRRAAHIIADAIYKRLTGEDGYFDTRVVYIAESGPADHRLKRLAIMDQDGENSINLTDGKNLVLTPRFSPSAQVITYMAYINKKPRVYLLKLDDGRQEVLGDFPGMTFAPRFSPDGNKVIMSLATNGKSDLYTMDLRTRQVTQLTNTPSINTSPCYSPKGDRIVFESDRGGTQQIYTMNADGSNVQRISFGPGRYASPVWSPRGDWIAFTKINGNTFSIGIIRPDGSGERILTEAFHVEGPTWAPNGRVLMYFKEKPAGPDGKGVSAKLYSIDLSGQNEREIVTPLDASDPAWSPESPLTP